MREPPAEISVMTARAERLEGSGVNAKAALVLPNLADVLFRVEIDAVIISVAHERFIISDFVADPLTIQRAAGIPDISATRQ